MMQIFLWQACKASVRVLCLLSFVFGVSAYAKQTETSSSGWSRGTLEEESFSPVPRLPGGMASFGVLTRLATVSVFDEVISYSAPVGPRISFTCKYDYIEAQKRDRRDYSHLGAGWSLSWVSFLTQDQKGNVQVNVPDGGIEFYRQFRKSNSSSYFKHNLMSHALLVARADGFERQLPDGSVEIYNVQGKDGRKYLAEVRDPAGNAARISYDSSFRLATITDAIGQVSHVKHASDDPASPAFFKVSKVIDPFGREGTFLYSKDYSQLLSSTDPLALVSKYEYASAKDSSMVGLITPYGVNKFQNYKPLGSPDGSRGLKITHPDGTHSVTEHWAGDRHLTYQWNRIASALYPTDPQKGDYSHCTITKWLMEAGTGKELSVRASVKEPLESEVVYSYLGQTASGFRGGSNLPSSISRRVTIRNADGTVGSAVQSSSFQYNRFGHVVRQIDPVGRTTSYLFALNDIDLHEIRQTRAGSNVLLAKYEYGNQHNVIRAFDAAGNASLIGYNKRGQITKTIDANQAVRSNAYDANGRVIAVYGPLSDKQALAKMTYDKYGRLQSFIDLEGQTTLYEYDNANRIVKVLFQDGTSEETAYDKLSAVSFKDRSGKITKRTFDNFGNITSVEDALGRKCTFEWCLCGALRKLTDAAGSSTEWHHDIQGRVIQKKFPNGSEVSFEFEKDGHRLLTKTDALKQVTKYAYTLDDSVSEKKYENAVNPTSAVRFKYASDYALISSASNELGTIEYQYFPTKGDKSGPSGGRLNSITNSAIQNSKITLDFDKVGNLVSQAINGNANSLLLAYDPMGRLISSKNLLGEFTYKYDDKPGSIGTTRIASVLYPNGHFVRLGYSPGDSRLRKITNSLANTSTPVNEFEYSYDIDGRINDWTEQFNGKINAKYAATYDAAGQLICAKNQYNATAKDFADYKYGYDKNSNRVYSEEGALRREAVFNTMNELVSVKQADKNSSSSSVAEPISYDLNGNLLSDGTRKYRWDAENRLVRLDYVGTDKHSEFFYNAIGQLEKIVEFAADKTLSTKQLIWYYDRLCEERDLISGKTRKIFSFGQNVDGRNIFYSRDQLGSVRATTDSTGAILAEMDYDPFGSPTRKIGDMPALQYAGYYTHEPSGLYLTVARAYDANLGRWLSRDPLGELGSGIEVPIAQAKDSIIASNLYAYVGNNTLNRFDPLGLQGQAVRIGVSDSGQNTHGRIWAISYAGSAGVEVVSSQPIIVNHMPQPEPQPEVVKLPPAPQGYGLPGTMGSQVNGNITLYLLFIMPNGFGIYGVPGYKVYVTRDGKTAWQYLSKPYLDQSKDPNGVGFSTGKAPCRISNGTN